MDTQPILNQSKNKPTVKVILAVLAIIVIGELIWAGITLTKGNKTNIPVVDNLTRTTTQPARIILQSDKAGLKIGEQVKVDILVDTGGKATDGTDVILNFDPKTLSVVTASVSAKPVSVGTIYTSYPKNSQEPDKVLLSGISGVGSSFSGQGLLGSVTFKALAAGLTTVAVDFRLGSTTDSNMIETGTVTDVLTEVKNLSLTILP